MNRVKEFRKELGISQLELAKDIGVSRQTINMIENDKYNPTLELCLNLARSLQTDLNSLFLGGRFLKKEQTHEKKKPSLKNSSNAYTEFLVLLTNTNGARLIVSATKSLSSSFI